MKFRKISFVVCCVILMSWSAATAWAAAEGSFQRNLKVNDSVDLDIETGSGNIEIRTGSSDQVQITGHIRANNNSWFGNSGGDAADKVKRIESNPPIQQSGNDIRIGHIDDPSLRRNISISYELVVPADTRLRSRTGSGNQNAVGLKGAVDLQTGSGNVVFSNIANTVRAESGSGNIEAEHVSGNVRAKSGSGDIRINDLSGGLDAESGSGSITMAQASAGSVRASTGSGDVSLSGVKGSLEASTGSGTVHAEGDPKGAWRLHTGSGSVRVRFPSQASYDLYAHTGSGGISVGPPITVQGSVNKHEMRGKVGGGGVPVELETGSGEIEIQ
ncbi:MAG TPA: DUF4097 family beta strand repeat-containing protein [Terriglobales bacterium]|nr:DUF4097 family beta strand repeat-containing protein [Terriglobales bacterium]